MFITILKDQKVGDICEKCSKGTVVKRLGHKNKPFMACNRFPLCKKVFKKDKRLHPQYRYGIAIGGGNMIKR